MSDRDLNKPFANIIKIDEFRQLGIHINEIQRRLRIVENRLPTLEAQTTQVFSSSTTQSSSHTHVMNQITDLSNLLLIELADVSLADPNADRIVFWDDSAGLFTHLVPNAGISITGTNLDVDHDAANNYVANEHIDWTSTAENFETSGTLKADGTVQFTAQVNFAGGTTYKVQADGDAYFKDLRVTGFIRKDSGDLSINAASGALSLNSFTSYTHLSAGAGQHQYFDAGGDWFFRDQDAGDATRFRIASSSGKIITCGGFLTDLLIFSSNLLMDGSGADDERARLPYLTAIPGSADNGSLWMEADGLHGYLGAAERNLSRPHCLSTYIDIKERQAVWNIHGGIISISTGNALDADPTDIDDTIGLGKIIIVINAGGDVTGEITVTGTTVDRDTGAETGADTDTITVDTLSTDNSGTDGGGNVTYAFVNAYMTTKWFKGAVTLSTVNLTLTDVDIYQCSFEQFNDLPNVVIDTFDTNQFANNTAANIYWHLYSVKPTGDKIVLAKEKSMELLAADVSANLYYRLRRGNLAISIDGTTQGFFVQCYPEPLANIYWEDINLKIWYT